MNQTYIDTVRLLLETVPAVFTGLPFAMKGGTALNLFMQDMPRLSVDIDVVFTDHTLPRDKAIASIAESLKSIRERLHLRGIETELRRAETGEETKLFVRRNKIVKVEVNHVFRGSLLQPVQQRLAPAAMSFFAMEVEAPTLAKPELYGSKLVAALDRQHPRDLFDVMGLYAGAGLTQETVECFVCYLAGHNRPVHEVLFSRETDITPAFQNEFQGMTREPVVLDNLLAVRRQLQSDLPKMLTANHRSFLLGFVGGEPDWSLMSCPHLQELPAIRWKLQNLAKLKKSNSRKFAQQADELRMRFET